MPVLLGLLTIKPEPVRRLVLGGSDAVIVPRVHEAHQSLIELRKVAEMQCPHVIRIVDVKKLFVFQLVEYRSVALRTHGLEVHP